MKLQFDIKQNKNVAIIGIIIISVVIGYFVYLLTKGKDLNSSIVITDKGTEFETSDTDNELYNHTLESYNNLNAQKAIEDGESYLSVLSNKNAKVEKSPEPEKINIEPPTPTPAPTIIYKNKYVRVPPNELINEQTMAILANWSTQPVHSTVRVSNDFDEYKNSLVQKVAENTGNSFAENSSVLISAFTLVPAILETDIDTDENSIVSVYIPTGKYKGARLFAMGYKLLTNTVDMTFTSMEYKGQSYEIIAKPIDTQSMRSSLSGSVNNRWFTRVIIPAIANGIGKTGQLYEQASSQNILPNGNVIQSYPEHPSSSAVNGTIIGGIANQMGKVLSEDAAKMPVKQVLISKNTTIGIRFLADVVPTHTSLDTLKNE